jgi:hypothetical protein
VLKQKDGGQTTSAIWPEVVARMILGLGGNKSINFRIYNYRSSCTPLATLHVIDC